MRFNLTPASHRVLGRASPLRLQRGIAAISSAKVLWAIFEEDECRAAYWLQEAGLSLEQFKEAFGIASLQSPIAPAFPQGSYGISPDQYTPPTPPPSSEIGSSRAGNNAPSIGNPFPDQPPPDESEREPENQQQEEPEDTWEPSEWGPSEMPKYSLYSARHLYSTRQQGQKVPQSRLQFYLDDQALNIGLLTPELENDLETVALRFMRQDRQQPISLAGGSVGGVTQIAGGMPAFTLTTEHLLLAAVLDNCDVGRWLRDNGFDAAELYQRIDELTGTTKGEGRSAPPFTEETAPLPSAADYRPLHFLPSLYRLLDAAANRGREALRVIEDYVRFILDDADLTQRLKTFRHQLQNVLQQFPMHSRLEARNTEHDVGTEISAEGEYQRPTVGGLLSANFSRLQESLRSLEEFSKMFDSQTARQLEQLRYQGYTLQKDVDSNVNSNKDSRQQTADGSRESAAAPPNLLPAVSRLHSLLHNARLYALADARADEETFKRFITDIIEGGVDIIQLRDKHADDRTLLSRSRILKECITASPREVLFIMNDRPDLAVLAGADGVHVGQEELPTALVRQIAGSLLVGVSTHSIEQARQAVLDGADYIGAGPIFESSTKAFTEFPGLAYLREAAAEMEIPAFAIGGITEERLEEVYSTGIHRIAVGSALLEAEHPREVAEKLKSRPYLPD